MAKQSNLAKFCIEFGLSIKSHTKSRSLKILKGDLVVFNLWHNDTLFEKSKKWSLNIYKENQQLERTLVDYGTIGKVLKIMRKGGIFGNIKALHSK